MKLTSPDILIAFMKQRGIGYDRLARYAGVSKGFISHLARGRKTTCTETVATRIAEALDVPRDVLFVRHLSAASGRNIPAQRSAA